MRARREPPADDEMREAGAASPRRGMRGVRAWTLTSLAAGMLCLGLPGVAQATTVGSAHFGEPCSAGVSWVDSSYVVPADGTITSFSYQSGVDGSGGTAGRNLAFKVWRLTGANEYTVIGTLDATLLTDDELETFAPPAPIDVLAGDLLGLWTGNSVLPGCIDLDSFDTGYAFTGNLAVGQTMNTEGACCGHLNVSAEFTDASQDSDGDGIGDTADNCVDVPNNDQANLDADAQGDACDPDDDNDTVNDGSDNCPIDANQDQANQDGDTLGDACDPDRDGDGADNGSDNCADTPNPGQANNDVDGLGDACDPDDDNDTVNDGADNCPIDANPDQANQDGDADGDACDPNDDNDALDDGNDSCRIVAAATSSGCPVAPRSVSLRYRSRRGDFTGRLTSPEPQCTSSITVMVTKKRPGADLEMGQATTGQTGKYRLHRRVTRGRYYAVVDVGVVPDVAECAGAVSAPPLRVR